MCQIALGVLWTAVEQVLAAYGVGEWAAPPATGLDAAAGVAFIAHELLVRTQDPTAAVGTSIRRRPQDHAKGQGQAEELENQGGGGERHLVATRVSD